MRRSIVGLALLLAPSASQADEATHAAAVAAAQQMLNDAYMYLGVTYLCQKTLGSSHYHAARTALEQTAMLGGKSEDDAVILADEMDKRVRQDVKLPKRPDDTKCLDQILSAQTALRVSQARFRKAAAADK